MVVHIALFRWKESVSKSEIDKFLNDVKRLKGKITEIVDVYAGENFSRWNEGYTHAIVVITKSRKDLDAYRAHPAHQPIAKWADKMEERSIGIDFES